MYTWGFNVYNTFVLTENNSLLAVGLDIGDKEKVTQVNGHLEETQTNWYSDDFVSIQIVEVDTFYLGINS